MKKHKLILIGGIILLLCLVTYSQEFDFRQVNWGMSKEEIKAVENKEIADEDIGSVQEIIAYNDKISSFDCYIGYIFVKDKLSSAGYYIKQEHTNRNDYIADYEKLKDLLTAKYGKTVKDEIYWKDDLYKNKEQDWGLAVSVGHVAYNAYWETPTTGIELMLKGDNYKIELVIKYISKELKDWATKVVREETLEGL